MEQLNLLPADAITTYPPKTCVRLRDGRNGIVCDPDEQGKRLMKTWTLILIDGTTKPRWIANGLFEEVGQ